MFFACTQLTNVTIPNSVISIGNQAFYQCPLLSIIIPASVTSISSAAFWYCSIKTITVDVNNPAFSSLDGVLFDKNRTVLITYPQGKTGSYTIPAGVASIGPVAFDNCSLTTITIPNGVTNIGTEAFQYCLSLTNVTISGSVANIGNTAFDYCSSLSAVYFLGNRPVITADVLYGTQATVYYLPGTIGWTSAFGYAKTALWNPLAQTHDGKFGVRTNQFGFTISGTTNIPIVIEASADLSNPAWVQLQSCTLTNGTVYFSDRQWTNYSRRFYRIRSP
jgi:hypothetical protein